MWSRVLADESSTSKHTTKNCKRLLWLCRNTANIKVPIKAGHFRVGEAHIFVTIFLAIFILKIHPGVFQFFIMVVVLAAKY